MFTFLAWTVVVILVVAMLHAYAISRDVFHPLIIVGSMMLFMYAWMPLKLDAVGAMDGFFQRDQLVHVATINLLGIIAFIAGCLTVSCQLPLNSQPPSNIVVSRLTVAGMLVGMIGMGVWVISLKNIGGISNLGEALMTGYSGGWDDSGYVRDGSLLLFPALLLILAVASQQGLRILPLFLLVLFSTPWVLQAVFAAKRGPAFMVVVTLAMGWFMNRGKRPPLLLTAAAGLMLGFFLLFLVSNRGRIYVDSDHEVTTNVTAIVERPDTGNEYIYGAGTVLSAEQRRTFFWGRRYLAEVLIRPIPSAIWPTKYEDFGLGELKHNAGTGEGFRETLGWEGAVGSAPGIIADLWIEFWWFNIPLLFVIGRLYAVAWRKANIQKGMWVAQYTILSALSIYLVMQTMEAILFRLLMLSIPLQLSFWLARHKAPVYLIEEEFEAGDDDIDSMVLEEPVAASGPGNRN